MPLDLHQSVDHRPHRLLQEVGELVGRDAVPGQAGVHLDLDAGADPEPAGGLRHSSAPARSDTERSTPSRTHVAMAGSPGAHSQARMRPWSPLARSASASDGRATPSHSAPGAAARAWDGARPASTMAPGRGPAPAIVGLAPIAAAPSATTRPRAAVANGGPRRPTAMVVAETTG